MNRVVLLALDMRLNSFEPILDFLAPVLLLHEGLLQYLENLISWNQVSLLDLSQNVHGFRLDILIVELQ